MTGRSAAIVDGDRHAGENDVPQPSAWAQERASAERERRRIMAAALDVMRAAPEENPRVSDIVARAGVSNNTFYRHFRGKDDLLLAVLDDGRSTLRAYLEHVMARDDSPAGRVRRWIEGMMAQASDPGAAAATRAVHLHTRHLDGRRALAAGRAEAELRGLLVPALAAAGSADPSADAAVIWQAVVGTMTDFLLRDTRPARQEVAHLVDFCLAGAGVADGA